MTKQDSRTKATRRRHAQTFKRELVERSLQPGASVSGIALDNGVNTNMLFRWRREHRRAAEVAQGHGAAQAVLLPVKVVPVTTTSTQPQAVVGSVSAPVPAGVIEIDIGAVRVRLRGAVDRSQRALRAAHAALDRMIGLPANTRVWLAAGHTDMRRGFDGLASMVQTALAANPFGGHLFVFRGRRGNIVKVLWFDGQGLCLFAKRLERGRFVWPQADTGAVSLTPAQMSMLLEGIDWRMPQRTWQPETLRPPQLAA